MRRIGVHVRSLRTPIIREGDDVARIVVDTLLDSLREDGELRTGMCWRSRVAGCQSARELRHH